MKATRIVIFVFALIILSATSAFSAVQAQGIIPPDAPQAIFVSDEGTCDWTTKWGKPNYILVLSEEPIACSSSTPDGAVCSAKCVAQIPEKVREEAAIMKWNPEIVPDWVKYKGQSWVNWISGSDQAVAASAATATQIVFVPAPTEVPAATQEVFIPTAEAPTEPATAENDSAPKSEVTLGVIDGWVATQIAAQTGTDIKPTDTAPADTNQNGNPPGKPANFVIDFSGRFGTLIGICIAGAVAVFIVYMGKSTSSGMYLQAGTVAPMSPFIGYVFLGAVALGMVAIPIIFEAPSLWLMGLGGVLIFAYLILIVGRSIFGNGFHGGSGGFGGKTFDVAGMASQSGTIIPLIIITIFIAIIGTVAICLK